jgi:hypothetical protein
MKTIRHLCSTLLGRNRRNRIRHPLNPDSAVRVTTYPLSREEVRILALHWAEEYVGTAVFCRLTRSCGTTDLWIYDYTADRWRAATAILGDAEMRKVGEEADARVREKIGEEAWAGYRAGEALWADGEDDWEQEDRGEG